MDKNRLWIIGAVLAIVALISGGWLIGISPQLALANTANTERANVVVANATNEGVLAKLKKDYLNIDALKSQLSTLQDAVPTSASISSFVTELNTLANTRKITLKSITVSDAKAYTPATQASQAAGSPQTNPKITAANFVIIPVAITISGDYGRVLDFVNDVQLGQRLFLVSSLSSTGSTDSGGSKGSSRTASGSGSQMVDSSIGGFVYVLLNK